MLLTLQRTAETKNLTSGRLFLDDGTVISDTIEPPAGYASACRIHNPEVKGRIPAGFYKVELTFSSKFGKILPILRHVPGFEGIRIHGGTKPEHTKGCILLKPGKTAQVINLLKANQYGERKQAENYIRVLDIGSLKSNRVRDVAHTGAAQQRQTE